MVSAVNFQANPCTPDFFPLQEIECPSAWKYTSAMKIPRQKVLFMQAAPCTLC